MSHPEPGQRGRISFPVESFLLENGLRILLLRRPHLPIVSLSVLVRAGVVVEGPEESGLAAFSAGLLSSGTVRRNALQLAEEIDALGASLGIFSDYDYALAGFSCLSRNLAEGIDTLSEVLLTPAFAPEEIERRRSDILSFLERKKDDPVHLVRNRFIARVYGDHPYHHPREGTSDSISRFHRSHIQGFYERFYTPELAILAVVGDIEPKTVRRLAADRFGGWRGRAAACGPLPAPPLPRGLQVERIQKDGMTQATLRLGGLGLRRNSPDHVPVVLMNYILGGGGFGSRLMKRLREEKGLTYGVSSDFHLREQAGYFYVECQTSVGRMNEAVREILAEIERMRQDGVSEEELESARRFFTGSLPLSFQTGDQISTRLLEKEFFGLEEEYWHLELERMRSTTREEVREAARRYLQAEKFTLVALADFRSGELEMEEQ